MLDDPGSMHSSRYEDGERSSLLKGGIVGSWVLNAFDVNSSTPD